MRVSFISRKAASWIVSLTLLISSALSAQEPVWTATLENEVEWSQISSAGTLFIGDKSGISHIDSESGEVLWQVATNKKLAPFNIHDIAGTGYVMIAEQFQNIPPKTQLSMYELMSGNLAWETEELLASNLAVIPDQARDQVLYIGAFPGSPSDKTNGTLLRSYDLTTGEMKYQTELGKYNEFPMHPTDTSGFFATATDLSGHASPVIKDNIIYLPYRGLTAVNLDTGEILWDHEYKVVDTGLKKTNTPPLIVGDVIYATGKGTVVAVNKHTGEPVWETKLKNKFVLPELQVVGDQIIVRIGGIFSNGKDMIPKEPFGVASLDRATGSEHWTWTKAKNSITNIHVMKDTDQIVVADSKNLYRLALSTGKKAEELEKRNLEFKRQMGGADMAVGAGKVASGLLSGGLVGGLQGGVSAAMGNDRSDPPTSISQVNGDLVVRGNYHILSYNPSSDTDNWSMAFKPPGINGMMLALSGAALALNAVGNAGYHTSMSARNTAVDNSLLGADRLGSAMTRRYAAAEQAGHLAFFLTTATKESGSKLQLMGINLATGEEVGSVPIEEKEPVFTVDNIERRVYYFHKGKEIRAFEF